MALEWPALILTSHFYGCLAVEDGQLPTWGASERRWREREQDREKEREQYDRKERSKERSKKWPSVQAVFGVTDRMRPNQLITLLTFEPGDGNLQF